jgi:hypothetical protein
LLRAADEVGKLPDFVRLVGTKSNGCDPFSLNPTPRRSPADVNVGAIEADVKVSPGSLTGR